MKPNSKGSGRKRSTYYLLLAFFVLVLFSVGFVAARYSYQNSSQGTIQSKEFYFSSDLLDGQTHTLAPGSTKITFSLGNYADDLRFSGVDVAYTVKVDGAPASGSDLTGTLSAGSLRDQKVTVSGLTPGQTYEITAEGVGGYHKTLRATIVIPSEDAVLYQYLDTSNPGYVLLTVWSKGVQGNVTITPPDSVIPDNTDAVMRSAQIGVAFTDDRSFSSTGYGSHVYRFFGSGVTVDDFTVKCGTEIVAEVKAPD